MPIEDIDFPEESFEVVISSLALHYIKSFGDVLDKVYKCLSRGGDFVFSVEHPILCTRLKIGIMMIRVIFCIGQLTIILRKVFVMLNFRREVIKYHRALTIYLNSLIKIGFEITGIVEPEPEENMLKKLISYVCVLLNHSF